MPSTITTRQTKTGARYVASTVALGDSVTNARDVLALLGADLPLSTAVHNSAVQFAHGLFSLFSVWHLNECKATASVRQFVQDNIY